MKLWIKSDFSYDYIYYINFNVCQLYVIIIALIIIGNEIKPKEQGNGLYLNEIMEKKMSVLGINFLSKYRLF